MIVRIYYNANRKTRYYPSGTHKPQRHLKNKGCTITKRHDGVYYISGDTMFNMQILVSRELNEKENIWLHSLQSGISQEEYQNLLLAVNRLDSKEKEIYGDAVLEIVSNANISNVEKWKEEEKMLATLEKVMASELEEKNSKVELKVELKAD